MSLAGKTVVITRGTADGQEWRQTLTDLGAHVYSLPTIMTSSAEVTGEITEALVSLEAYDWIVFTSANGVRYLADLSAQLGIDLSAVRLPKIAAVGPLTASAAESAGLQVAFQPSVPDSAHLAAELDSVEGKRVLLLRAAIAPDSLPNALMARGADVADLRIYKTELIKQPDPECSRLLADGAVDYITFASPSAVAGLQSRLSDADLALARQVQVVSIGASVTEALQQAGFQHVHTAKIASLQGVTDTLQQLSEV